jgi:Membrane protein involved in the export of O-antigen and teichoic acid
LEYKNKDLIRGFVWSGLDKLGVVFLQLALELILARLLLPKDYGVIGVVLVFISLAITFSEGGFSNALVHKLNRTETDFSTVFYFNMITSFLIVIIIFLIAPTVEKFFNISGLTLVLRVISVSIILNSVVLIHKVKLSIAMDFKSQAKYSLAAVFLSGIIGVYLAYHQYGVWALVFQNVAMAFFNAVFLWIGFRWFPKLEFSVESLKSLFSFGSKILASSLLQAAYFNSYPFLIGRVLSTRDLGLYAKSNQFTLMPSSVLTTVLQRVLFPYFSSHQSDDDRIFGLNQLYTKLSCLIFFPLFFVMAMVAQPLIIILFSEKWQDMTGIFVILCVAYTFYPLIVNNMMMFQVKNKTSLFLKIEILTKIIGLVFLLATINRGLIAIAYGILAQQIIQFIITSFFVQSVLNKNWLEQIKIILPFFFFSIGLLFLIRIGLHAIPLSLIWKLFLGLFFAVVGYMVFYFIFYRKDIMLIPKMIRGN